MLVYGKYECFVMQLFYVCVLCASCGSSQCCVLHDLQFVNDRRCKRQPYGRGILQNRSHDCLIGHVFLCWCICLSCVLRVLCCGVVAMLLLNVMAVFSVGGGWIDRVWYSKKCACSACDPSVHLSVPSIGFVYVFVCRKLSPHLGV